MKKLLIVLILFTSCCNSTSSYKASICGELLAERNRCLYHSETDNINRIDSMFIKCRCDTLK